MKSRFGAVPGIVAAIFALMVPVFFSASCGGMNPDRNALNSLP
jgi:hypothetical protein